MFLNKTRFKKLVKDAYNRGGLRVGQIYGGLVICGGYWITWTEEGYVPNWVKAALMEYAGELPKEGYLFKAKKDDPVQYEISENEMLNLPEIFMKAKVPFTVTPIVYDEKWKQYRFLQNDITKDIIAVNTYLYDVLDMKELGEENRPMGPCSIGNSGEMLIWKNEHSALVMYKTDITDKNITVMGLLSEYAFDKEDY